jgi:hypothetical protein
LKKQDIVDPALKEQFAAAGDLQGKVVAEGDARGDPVATKAMEIFVGAYGSEAGVAALKYIPLGGLFLAGGLTPKNLHHIEPKGGAGGGKLGHIMTAEEGMVQLQDAVSRNLTMSGHGKFLAAFRDKGRLSPLLLKVPVYAVMDQGLGQRGAHYIAIKLLRQLLNNTHADTTHNSSSSDTAHTHAAAAAASGDSSAPPAQTKTPSSPHPTETLGAGNALLCFLAGVAITTFAFASAAARKK